MKFELAEILVIAAFAIGVVVGIKSPRREAGVVRRFQKRGYHLISEARIRAAVDAVGPRIVGGHCATCGGKESETSPQFVDHAPTCAAVARGRGLRMALLGWPSNAGSSL